MLMPQNENHLTQKSGSRAIRGGCANKIWMAWHQEQLEKDSQARSTDRANLSKSRRTTFGKAETIYDLNQVAFGDWNRSEVSEYDEYPGQDRTIPRGGFTPLGSWCVFPWHFHTRHFLASLFKSTQPYFSKLKI